jgi:hypothetical protein
MRRSQDVAGPMVATTLECVTAILFWKCHVLIVISLERSSLNHAMKFQIPACLLGNLPTLFEDDVRNIREIGNKMG